MATSVRITYDRDADILYVTFGPPTHSTGYELGDQILLRVNPESNQPSGLTIRNFSYHVRSRVGIPLPALGGRRWPSGDPLEMLRSAPVNRFLLLGEDDRGPNAVVLRPALSEAVAA